MINALSIIMKAKISNSKLSRSKLIKKMGDDKLVVSLVLIAVGVVLCYIYRTSISASITTAISSLDTKIKDMFDSATV